MQHQNSPSGTYRYKDCQIIEAPYFIYDVDIYIIYKNKATLLSNKLYKSDKLLNIPECQVIKRSRNSILERFITLLGAPISFIKENSLSKYELKTNKKNEKRTR